MSTTTPATASESIAPAETVPRPLAVPPDQQDQPIDLWGVPWDMYVRANDAFVERHNPRMIYCGGHLILMTRSWLHEWLVDCLGDVFKHAATGCEVEWEPVGETTLRRRDVGAGQEGDATFYVGPNAVRLRGPKEIDLNVDPPPDLAIEVEVSHPADDAMQTWGRLGTPEVWRFEAAAWTCSFWRRRDDGTYESAARSQFLPLLEPAEITNQIRRAEEISTPHQWYVEVQTWARDVLRPRLGGGG